MEEIIDEYKYICDKYDYKCNFISYSKIILKT